MATASEQPREFARLARLRPLLGGAGGRVLLGVGDDAAVLDPGGPVVVCTDTIVEDVHFTWALSGPADVGWKAAAVNLSDLAAMAAEPLGATVSLMLPATCDEALVDAIYEGLSAAARTYGMPIIGGDTVSGPVLALTVTALGRPVGPRGPVTRSGATPGQEVVLDGHLGAAAAALRLHGDGRDVPWSLLDAHRRPTPRVEGGVRLAAAGATAMIDISDGLGGDLGHVARSSDVTIVLQRDAVLAATHPEVRATVGDGEALRLAIGGGEDFALAATLRRGSRPDEAVVVGRVEAGPPAVLLDGEDVATRGYEHG